MSTETNPEFGERHTPPDDDIAGYVPGDEYDDEETAADDLAPVEAEAGAAHVSCLAVRQHRLGERGQRRRRQVRRRGDPGVVKRLPNAPGVYRMIERRRRRALCRQGAQPEEARHQLRAGPFPHQPHRPHGARDRDDGVRRHPHRDRSAAARSESDQALAAALQRADARRQIVPLHPADRRPPLARRSSSIAARARARASISARSPRPARSGAPSIRCSAPSCCAPARTRCSRAARGRACSTRSSAAPALARARSARRTMPSWSARPATSCPARARR